MTTTAKAAPRKHRSGEILLQILGGLVVVALVDNWDRFIQFMTAGVSHRNISTSWIFWAYVAFVFNIFRQIHGLAVATTSDSSQKDHTSVLANSCEYLGLLGVIMIPAILVVHIKYVTQNDPTKADATWILLAYLYAVIAYYLWDVIQFWKEVVKRDSSHLSIHELVNVASFAAKLHGSKEPVSQFLSQKLRTSTCQKIVRLAVEKDYDQNLKKELLEDLNAILDGPAIDEQACFSARSFTLRTTKLINRRRAGKLADSELLRLNRAMLVETWPEHLGESWGPRKVFKFVLLFVICLTLGLGIALGLRGCLGMLGASMFGIVIGVVTGIVAGNLALDLAQEDQQLQRMREEWQKRHHVIDSTGAFFRIGLQYILAGCVHFCAYIWVFARNLLLKLANADDHRCHVLNWQLLLLLTMSLGVLVLWLVPTLPNIPFLLLVICGGYSVLDYVFNRRYYFSS